MRSAEWDDRHMRVAHGRVALVMGSSRGLGAVIARRLARGGGTAEAFGADVTHERQVAELVAAITGRFGPVDVLVLNATGPRQPEVNRLWAPHVPGGS
jgi:3-oxoacyl-[acyl-carrier protein] reductase